MQVELSSIREYHSYHKAPFLVCCQIMESGEALKMYQRLEFQILNQGMHHSKIKCGVGTFESPFIP